MSPVVKTIDIAELPDWLAAVKRRDAAATFHPGNDDWPLAKCEGDRHGLFAERTLYPLRREKSRNLHATRYRLHLARLVNERGLLGGVGSIKHHIEEQSSAPRPCR
jgi:hypothetical protein